jgi:hypothetical protein
MRYQHVVISTTIPSEATSAHFSSEKEWHLFRKKKIAACAVTKKRRQKEALLRTNDSPYDVYLFRHPLCRIPCLPFLRDNQSFDKREGFAIIYLS